MSVCCKEKVKRQLDQHGGKINEREGHFNGADNSIKSIELLENEGTQIYIKHK